MKIILVGATGTIGHAIFNELSKRHEVIPVSRNSKNVTVDISDRHSIEAMYKKIGAFDALISAAGHGYTGPFDQMTEENFYQGIRSKLMGQINLVMVGKNSINDNGSFTLISGVTAEDPVRHLSVLSMANGGLNAFVKAAALELKRGLRINIVSPGLVEESVDKLSRFFPGHNPVPMKKVVNGFIKSVEGGVNGQVITVYA